MFIIIEDVDIISSNPTNTAIPLIAPVLMSLLVPVFVPSLYSRMHMLICIILQG